MNLISGVDSIKYKEVFEKDFPIQNRGLIIRAVHNGFKAVSEAYNSEKWLSWEVGEDFLKFFRRIAVEHQIKQYIEKGLIRNISCNISKNNSGNYNHIEIVGNNSIYTVSQTEYSKSIPRKSKYRDKLARQTTQIEFDFWEEYNINSIGKYYGMLTYGSFSDTPQFINIGFPDVNIKGWIYQNELLNQPYEIYIPEKEIIVAEKEALVSFKFEKEKVKYLYEGQNS